ncbi:MAG: toll/interleukin-1 receptor domain-containing protein [Anaerolineae bacterium]|nr:toll/interleukin-1 receptor domain-containing protein [Anaerolineae bacterium]MDQ7033595.1 toll/interleukin-1 receptor domain-containing protein [Anaerolineae bacterium]
MDEQPKTQFAHATDKDKAIEVRRAMLRKALQKVPDDARLQDTLKQLLQPYYIQRAAKQGVFICYSRVDELFALDLSTDLREVGVEAFMDEMDVGNDDDSEWGEQVGKALRNCGLMLLVMSPHSLHDAEVQGERLYFLKNGKVVIPVIAQKCKMQGLEMVIPPIDFVQDYQASLEQLLQLLVQPRKALTQS